MFKSFRDCWISIFGILLAERRCGGMHLPIDAFSDVVLLLLHLSAPQLRRGGWRGVFPAITHFHE
jgi:hypothetical protein